MTPRVIRGFTEEFERNPYDVDRIESSFSTETNPKLVPVIGDKWSNYADEKLDIEFCKRGERDITAYAPTQPGRMSQELYALFKNDDVTKENIARLYPTDRSGDESRKMMYITRRYYKDANGMIRDATMNNRIVYDPIHTFDIIMSCHLMNKHLGSERVYRCLREFYANGGPLLIKRTLEYCSVCNPSLKLTPKVQPKPYLFEKALPLERITIEIIEPFPNEKVEGKYSNMVVMKDFIGRFEWLEPLKNTKFKNIVPVVAKMILSFPRVPIWVESNTLDWSDLFDIFEMIVTKYGIKIGLGCTTRSSAAQATARINRDLNDHHDECLFDFNNCLKYGPTKYNQIKYLGFHKSPCDIISHSETQLKAKFRAKRAFILKHSPSSCVMNRGMGTLYLESPNGIQEDAAASSADELSSAKDAEDEERDNSTREGSGNGEESDTEPAVDHSRRSKKKKIAGVKEEPQRSFSPMKDSQRTLFEEDSEQNDSMELPTPSTSHQNLARSLQRRKFEISKSDTADTSEL
ncbi:replication fork barrier binding protein FOB1 KNAG_0H03240 [Huiozyma naganishii CBS 8797]|uniref:Uncharacterized protein n=1 Tax=Huiozyma naganishii (strain ATCC MYA-139 / BCRC 22969 / CBS 8797 / KCTC 17520 / NBRC 10181 / NCYC 3082 / Yp74L-3) TaxID=1071383 RepID=J7S8U0_HUIN7|nr:hypothetical protein KNAG_0H03240 [Kazachstania naganishii CBS 8797]CCK71739.1 hypothetical protein KNAG_0H03240 [Kazachstania naganishii CBS 8797]